MQPASVLLVEPHDDERIMYADYLRHLGIRTFTSGTAADALRAAFERAPDVIVLEPCLGGSTRAGLAFIRTTKSDVHTRGIPIVVVSGHALDYECDAAIDAGCDAFFAKPFPPESLGLVVERFVRTERRRGG